MSALTSSSYLTTLTVFAVVFSLSHLLCHYLLRWLAHVEGIYKTVCLPSISPATLHLRCPISHPVHMTALGLWSELVSNWTICSILPLTTIDPNIPVLRQKTIYYKGLGHIVRIGMLPFQPCGWKEVRQF